MHITYDPEADALYVSLLDVPAEDAVEIEEGVTVDLDAKGHVIGLEVLDARERMGGDPLDNVTLERLLPEPDEADAQERELAHSGE
jgi:uncharacterized protein YuzE